MGTDLAAKPKSSMNPHIASNLAFFRQMHELSQKTVAEKAGLSLPGYRALETGRSTPRLETLTRLAGAFSVQTSDLLIARRTLSSVRFRSKGVLKRRDQILYRTQQWLAAFALLQDLVGEKPISKIDRFREVAHPLRKKPAEAADLLRREMGLGANETIRNIAGLVEHVGIKVYQFPTDSVMFFGLAVGAEDGGPAIVVNTNDRITVERWIFTVAHEFAHLVLHADSFNRAEVDEIDDQEREADALAGHFLMPNGVFFKEWDSAAGLSLIDRVLKVKRIFRVSYMTVLYRLVKSGRADGSIWESFRQKYASHTGHNLGPADEPGPLGIDDFRLGQPPVRRSAEPAQLDSSDFVEDQFAHLVRRAVLSRKISLNRAAELLNTSLPELRVRALEWGAA